MLHALNAHGSLKSPACSCISITLPAAPVSFVKHNRAVTLHEIEQPLSDFSLFAQPGTHSRIHLTGGAVMLCEENHLCGPVHFSKQRRETNKMEAVLQPQPRRTNLLLHCEAHAVDRAVASTSRTTGLRYIYESQEGRIMLILWKVTQGKPPG